MENLRFAMSIATDEADRLKRKGNPQPARLVTALRTLRQASLDLNTRRALGEHITNLEELGESPLSVYEAELARIIKTLQGAK
jgi:hypothetical protein